MKGINKFFYRIDVIKKAYFMISIPMMLACWFYPVGFWLFILLPISTLGLVSGLIKLKIPNDEDIIKETFAIHGEYESKIMRQLGGTDDIDSLCGFSGEKGFFKRRIGSRAVYPVCRTLVLAPSNDALDIYMKDSPLMEGLAPIEQSFKLKGAVDVKTEDGKNGCVLSFAIDGESIEIISADKHKAKEIFGKYKKYFRYNENAMK